MNEEAKNKIKTERGISQELKRLKREIKTVRSKEKLLKKWGFSWDVMRSEESYVRRANWDIGEWREKERERW